VATQLPFASDLKVSAEESAKRVNNARNRLRDLMERWNNRPTLKRHVWREEYLRGRMAFVFECEIAFTERERNHARPIHETSDVKLRMFIVLKADIPTFHKLNKWNDELVLVPAIEVVKCPDGVIPSLVGFYFIHDKLAQGRGSVVTAEVSVLFQSAIDGRYKFLPLISDWERCVFVRGSSQAHDHLPNRNVEGTPKIMQGVSQYQGRIVLKRFGVEQEAKVVLPTLFLDNHGVVVETVQESVKVLDVLVGPFNL